jgi:putative hydrolase of the HAD superfamily
MVTSDATDIVDALTASEPIARAGPPRVVGFDGDDTLWTSEGLFTMTQGRFRTLLLRHVDLPSDLIDARLTETVQRNLALYGYGVKGFTLSMVETAIAVTDGRIPATDIAAILSFGRMMLEHPVELVEGAREVLETLRARGFELWLVADGDVFDQESKLARSGLASLFHAVEIVSRKDPETYRKLLGRYGVLPEEFAMVGDTLGADVLPVIEIGGRAYHVPAPTTAGAVGSGPAEERGYRTLARLRDLLQVLDTPEGEGP